MDGSWAQGVASIPSPSDFPSPSLPPSLSVSAILPSNPAVASLYVLQAARIRPSPALHLLRLAHGA